MPKVGSAPTPNSEEMTGLGLEQIRDYEDLPVPADDFHGEPAGADIKEVQRDRIVEEINRAYPLLAESFARSIEEYDEEGPQDYHAYHKMVFEAVSPGNIARWREEYERQGSLGEELETRINENMVKQEAKQTKMVKIIRQNAEALLLKKLGISPEEFNFVASMRGKKKDEIAPEDWDKFENIGGRINGEQDDQIEGSSSRVEVDITNDVVEDQFKVEMPPGKRIVVVFHPHISSERPGISIQLT